MAGDPKIHVQWLLAAELVFAFAPVALLLLLGLIMSPFQIGFLFTREDGFADLSGALYVVGLSVVGLLALTRFASVAVDIISGRKPSAPRRTTLGLFVLGIGGLVFLLIESESNSWRVVFLLPLIATLHFVYLGRD